MRTIRSSGAVTFIARLITARNFASAQDAAADVSTWTLVAPSDTALPSVAPPSSFNRSENVVFPVGLSGSLDDARPSRLHTNKFYSNFVIDGPSRSAWTLPYIVTVNNEFPYGIYVSYPKYFPGQTTTDGRLKWYASAAGKDIIMSAEELDSNQEASLVDFGAEGMSATVSFASEDHPGGQMTTFLVRGMAYATVSYENFTPEVSSIHAILRVNGKSVSDGSHTSSNGRFQVELNDGSTWLLYCSEPGIEFHYTSALPNEPNGLLANGTMTGTLRATRVPYDADSAMFEEAVAVFDEHAAVYPIESELWAWMNSTDSSMGRYSLSWKTGGDSSAELIHYALSHHQDSLPSEMMTGIFLSSPTKGNMQLVKGSNWTITETDLPDFEWLPPVSAITSVEEMEWIEHHLEIEISAPLDDVAGSSVYFGGKNLMAYAQLCLIAGQIGRDELVESCVDQVVDGLNQYLESANGNPLVYDTTWGGVVGSLGLEEGSEGADFYSTFYNDHHFHYSYLLNAAAVVAHLRPHWANASNKNWIDTLIRDVNDPNKDDPYFPQFRSFDWFCGHSWARGLLFAYDGKDQESTSEDVNFFYAMTIWAIATGNSRLEGLGRLQTGVVSRSINTYFLLKDSNENHPVDFVRNKVTGILFENKVDYTTWFGENVEYIHGIQNIPVTAMTEYVRAPEFVREEWDQRLASVVDTSDGVWKTVLYMSYAVVQKHIAFEEMLSTDVDNGLLRAWALYWAASRPECFLYCNHDEIMLEGPPSPTPAPVIPMGAYLGNPAQIPGTVEAEAFDYGGEGIAYADTDAGNNGGALRMSEGVDIKEKGGGGYYVGWTQSGEYLRYTVEILENASAYDFVFVVASPLDTGLFRIVTGGTSCSDYTTDLSGDVAVASTESWTAFETLRVSGAGSGGLDAGETTIFLCVDMGGFNIGSFDMTITGSPASATPSPTTMGGTYFDELPTIPGKVEAEEFDVGGAGVAYEDADPSNNGGALRLDEEVDVMGTNSGAFYVSWTAAGEYLRYTVHVLENASSINFDFVVASPSGSGSFMIVTGGSGCSDYTVDLSGLVEVPSTGGWAAFDTLSVPGQGSGGLEAGRTTIYLCVVTGGFNIESFTTTVSVPDDSSTPSPSISNGAYMGDPVPVPGTLEAEEFDTGGEGVAYHDSDAGNNGGELRTDVDVDIKSTTSGGYYIGWIRAGEYLRYTVDVQKDVASFDFDFIVASPVDSGSLRVVSGGTGCSDYTSDLTGLVDVPSTGGWGTFETLSITPAGDVDGLAKGQTHLWLCSVSSGFNIDSFTMRSSNPMLTGPYLGAAAVVPGTIEAEEFDYGGAGEGYVDTDAGNNGGVFRDGEDVDIQDTPSGGYAVGWTRGGEYLRYTVDVQEKVNAFMFEFLVAAPAGKSGSFRVVTGGAGCSDYTVDLTGLVRVVSTGGWDTFASVPAFGGGDGGLSQGVHTLWFCVVSAGFNLDSFAMAIA